jgi:hypothetical protein
MVCKFKMSHHEGIISLKLSIHMVIMDMWRCVEKKLSHSGVWGEIRKTSSCKHNQEICYILLRSISSASSSSEMRKVKICSWYYFFLTGLVFYLVERIIA